jgi:hypothetical protein
MDMGQSVFARGRGMQPSGFSIYEVGRSGLGQALPATFRGQLPIWRYLLSGLPLLVLGLGIGFRHMLFASFGDFRLGYLLGIALMVSVAGILYVHASRVRQYNGLALRYMYAQEHVLPALHYSGVIASVEDTVRLLARELVELNPKENLYGANLMRLVRLESGEDIIQFERA